ncbi:MAG: hypothetical protein DWQ37_10585 [Planctomycetota bacterium]|nr:MAG: hypothetical protein DWQ37_10585 [Planctomycetota bacterium]
MVWTLILALAMVCSQAAAQVQNRVARRGPSGAAARPGRHHHHHQHRHRGHRRGANWWFDVELPWFACPIYTLAFDPYLPPISYFGYTFTLPAYAPADPVVPAAPAAVANLPAAPAPDPVDDPPGLPKATNGEQKARAGRFIGYGDKVFADQRYLAALERYKTAGEVAPDLADTYFRQGFAQVALGHYEKAARAYRRGLRLRGDWQASPFRLDQLYAAPVPKNAHIEALAREVQANPFDGELLMVLGMQLYFDGEPQRAEAFFSRAAQLGANEDRLLDAFLPQPQPADPADPAGGNGKIVF